MPVTTGRATGKLDGGLANPSHSAGQGATSLALIQLCYGNPATMPKLDEIVTAWDDALKRLHKATAVHEAAAFDEMEARKRTTSALNEINCIQKEMDKLDADLRAAMPRDSDWSRRTKPAADAA